MQKRLLAILVGSLLLILGVSVSATESPIRAQMIYDASLDSYLVSGTVLSDRGNIPVTLEMTLGGQTVAVSQTVALRIDGEVRFSFPPLQLSDEVLSGTITAVVTAMYLNATDTFTYVYQGADYYLGALQTIQAAIAGTGNLGNVCFASADGLGIDGAAYVGLEPEAKALWEQSLKALTLSLPTDYLSPAEKTQIKEELQKFRDAYQKAIAIAQFSQLANASEMDAWLTSYAQLYGFNQEDLQTAYSEVKLWQYYSDVKNTTALSARIVDKNALTQMEEIKKYVYECILLTAVETGEFQVVRQIMTEFSALFPADWSRMNALSSEQQGSIYASVAGKKYDTYQKAAEALNALLPADTPVILPPAASGGGGGGGGNFSVSPGAVEQKPQTVPQAKPFDDLANAPWAEEAILKLYDAGILSGKGNRTFEPTGLVTRGEFIKILVLATKQPMEKAYTHEFSDASSADWYYPYLCAAVEAGLLLGDGSGSIRPNEEITREDIAVLLYRAYKIGEELSLPELTFSDAFEVSDYAVSAVSYFSMKGIINGIGDNLFAPKKTASRAEAAKLIYGAVFGE